MGLPWWLSGKESACSAGDAGSIPAREDPLEEEMTPHSSILIWEMPWTEEPGGLSPWGYKESDTTEGTEYTGVCVCVYLRVCVCVCVYLRVCVCVCCGCWWGTSVVSDSMRPYGQQPTRLLCPQDSLGKNTGMVAISFSSIHVYIP